MRPPLGFLPNGEAVQNGYKALVAMMSKADVVKRKCPGHGRPGFRD
jgi:hypothetical protein